MTWPRYLALAAIALGGAATAAPLTYGSTLALRIGSGTAALSSTSTQTVRARVAVRRRLEEQLRA
jgi:hypothetical protein